MAKSVKMPDGATINFPDEMDDATIHQEGMKYMQEQFKQNVAPGVSMMGPSNQKPVTDDQIDFARPFVANAAGGAAAALAAPSGPGAFAARTGAYSVIDALMQELKQKSPDSIGSALGEGAIESLKNSGMQKLLQFGGRAIGSLRNAGQPEILNFSPTTSQALKATGSGTLSVSAAKGLEDLSITAKQKALDRTAGAGFTQALQFAKKSNLNPQAALDNVAKEMPIGLDAYTPIKIDPGQKYQNLTKTQNFQPHVPPSVNASGETQLNALDSFGKVDAVIKDANKLQDTLSAAQANGVGFNLKKSLQEYHFTRLFNDSMKVNPETGGLARLDPKALADSWYDPKMEKSIDTLYNSQQRSDIEQFFKNIAMTQDKVNTNPIAKKILFLHGGASLAAGLFTGHLAAGAASATGVVVGAEVLGKLLTKPGTARLMVNLAGGGPLGMSDTMAGRLLVNALQGETVAIQDAQGQQHPGILGKDGKFVPLQSQVQ